MLEGSHSRLEFGGPKVFCRSRPFSAAFQPRCRAARRGGALGGRRPRGRGRPAAMAPTFFLISPPAHTSGGGAL
eukprot:9482946-Pyramimonas_sp.AAC.1